MLAWIVLMGCGAQSNLIEDTTAAVVVPDGSDYDGRLAVDPANTGVAIRPGVAWVSGTTELRIENHSGGALLCEAWHDDLCPVDALDAVELAAGEAWEERVDCFLADVACFELDAAADERPLRAWTWFVEPADDDASAE